MKQLHSLSRFCIASSIALGAIGTAHASWPQIYNGPGNGQDFATSIACDVNGNTYVLGEVQGVASGRDILVVKYNRLGVQQYASIWNSDENADDHPAAIGVDSAGNAFVAGYTDGEGATTDFITYKIQPNGSFVWAHTVDGPFGGDDLAVALSVDSAGAVVVTGTTQTDGFGTDFLTVKYDNSGSLQWTRTYSGDGLNADDVRAIATDASNNVYVTGRTYNGGNYYDFGTLKYSPTGTLLWTRKLDGPIQSEENPAAIAVTAQGNIVVTGTSDGASFTSDFLTVEYDANGTKLWQTRTGTGTINEIARGVAVDSVGKVYVVGTSGSDGEFSDILTVKYDEDGNKEWSKLHTAQPKSFSGDTAVAIQVDDAFNVYVAGSVRENNSSEGEKIVTLKYTEAGAKLYAKTLQITSGASAAGLAIDRAKSKVIVTGSSFNSATSNFDIITDKY